MQTEIKALRRAGNRVATILIALCVAFSTAGPDLLRASETRQACCRLKHACACHKPHASGEQAGWYAVPSCSDDCRHLARLTANWSGIVPSSTQLIAAPSGRRTPVHGGVRRVQTQRNTSLYQRPPPSIS